MTEPITEDASKEAQRITQIEARYMPLSAEPDEACANCRFFSGSSSMCTLIQNYPEDVLPTGYCNRWEARNIPQPVSEDAVAGLADAILQSAQVVQNIAGSQLMERKDEPEHEQPVEGYIAPDSAAEGVFKALVGRFKRGMKPGLSVLKGADGKRYMLIVTSNAYQDREGETITTPALKEWVDTCWKSVEGQFATDNPLVFWHDMRVKMGDIVWADVRGPFLVELARESDGLLARKMMDYVEAHPDEKWGASHKFGYFKSQKDSDGTYHRIFKKETTVLPREAAANALTFSGVIPMASKRDEFLNKMLGVENAAELLDKGIEPLIAELQKRGVEHKSADGKDETPADASKGYETLLVDVIKAQADLDERLESLKTEHAAELKTAADKYAVELKAVTDRLEVAEAAAKAAPKRASQDAATQVDTNKLVDEVKNSMVTKDPVFKLPVSG